MKTCFCNRLYHISTPPTSITEYAFSGSLCYIREFQTDKGSRYCLSIFSLSNYKHLHFPHEEYKYIVNKLNTFLSIPAIFPTTNISVENLMSIVQLPSDEPFDDNIKIKFGAQHRLTIGPITAIGLVKTSPFTDVNVFSENENRFTCTAAVDICTCKLCPVFKRLTDFETSALMKYPHRKPETVILF